MEHGPYFEAKNIFFTRIFYEYLVLLKHKLHTSSKYEAAHAQNLAFFLYICKGRTVYNMLIFTFQGPVVQSIASSTSSLRGQLVKCLRLNNQIY